MNAHDRNGVVTMATGPRAMLALCAVLLAAVFWAAPAQAHEAQAFYPYRWASGSNLSYGFQTGFPLGEPRLRALDARGQWNARGGEPEPDFYNTLGDQNFGSFFGCGQQNAIYWMDLDFHGASTVGLTRTCRIGTRLNDFRIAMDNDRVWYTGTGDAPSSQLDMWSVFTHEFGHATGFSSHFGEGDSACGNDSNRQTMCPSIYLGTERQRTLATHDIHTFEGAYF
jgi:hypothetical protein